MKFKVGDKVRIVDDVENNSPLYSFNNYMIRLQGKPAQIVRARLHPRGTPIYTIDIDDGMNYWEDSNLRKNSFEWD